MKFSFHPAYLCMITRLRGTPIPFEIQNDISLFFHLYKHDEKSYKLFPLKKFTSRGNVFILNKLFRTKLYIRRYGSASLNISEITHICMSVGRVLEDINLNRIAFSRSLISLNGTLRVQCLFFYPFCLPADVKHFGREFF